MIVFQREIVFQRKMASQKGSCEYCMRGPFSIDMRARNRNPYKRIRDGLKASQQERICG